MKRKKVTLECTWDEEVGMGYLYLKKFDKADGGIDLQREGGLVLDLVGGEVVGIEFFRGFPEEWKK